AEVVHLRQPDGTEATDAAEQGLDDLDGDLTELADPREREVQRQQAPDVLRSIERDQHPVTLHTRAVWQAEVELQRAVRDLVLVAGLQPLLDLGQYGLAQLLTGVTDDGNARLADALAVRQFFGHTPRTLDHHAGGLARADRAEQAAHFG